jgi:hypothetical protein
MPAQAATDATTDVEFLAETPSGTQTSTKDHLESEKLRLEIATLRRAWWQSPTLAATLVASLVTICLSWAAGLFDLRRDQITLETNRARFERDQLKLEIANQEQQKLILEGEQRNWRASGNR